MAHSLAERVTESFYAWELRGRGWQTAREPVMLEPYFRHCHLLPTPETGPVDDGKRPTLFSSLVERFAGPPSAASVPALNFTSEHDHWSIPAPETDLPQTFALTASPAHATSPAVDAHIIEALAVSLQPLSFEILGNGREAQFQFAIQAGDAPHLKASLAGFAPELTLTRVEDPLFSLYDKREAALVVDLGLANEFFLPIASFGSFAVDPWFAFLNACAQLSDGEHLVMQVMFERCRNQWNEAIRSAVLGPDGTGVFEDAPEFLPLAKEKTAAPLFAVSLRLIALAASEERTLNLMRATRAFVSQFERPGSNSLIPLEAGNIDPEEHLATVVSRTTYRSGMLLSLPELLAFVHLPSASLRHPLLRMETARNQAWQGGAETPSLILGEHSYRDQTNMIGLTLTERLQHTHIIGATGTGKSTLLINAACQDAAAGHGFIVLDPHGDLIDDLLGCLPETRHDDIVLFDPSDAEHPIGFNILYAQDEFEKQLLASDLVSIFERLATSWGDAMNTLLANSILALLESRKSHTLIDLRHFLTDKAARATILATVDDPEVVSFWENSFPQIGTRSIGPILTRLDGFLRSKLIRNIVGQRTGGLNIERAVEGRQIILAKLSQGLIGEENASLLGSLLITKLHQTALRRQRVFKGERHPFFVYADEFQHFVTPSMALLLTEGRKYGVGMVLAHQHLGQIRGGRVEEAVLGNSYARVAFRPSDDDAKKLAQGFAFFEASDLLNLKRGQAIARIGGADRDVAFAALPPPSVADAEQVHRRQIIIAQSRERYGAPIDAIRVVRSESNASSEQSPERERSAPVEPAASPSPSHYDPLAEAAPKRAYDNSRHRYLQHLLKRLGEEQGFRGTLEQRIGSGRVDVVLRRDQLVVAFEICVNTDPTHEFANVKKCLAGGVTALAVVSDDPTKRERISKALQDCDRDRVTVLASGEIPQFLGQFATLEHEPSTIKGYKVRIKRSPVDQGSGRDGIIAAILRGRLSEP